MDVGGGACTHVYMLVCQTCGTDVILKFAAMHVLQCICEISVNEIVEESQLSFTRGGNLPNSSLEL